MKKILLDTNVYTGLLTGDQRVLDVLAKAEIVYMSVIMMGELYAGFRGEKKEVENKQLLEKFLQKPTVRVIDVTQETSEIFGEIKDSLKKAGKPIPINDVWLAAHCMETGAVLITYDNHFKKVMGLRLWDGL